MRFDMLPWLLTAIVASVAGAVSGVHAHVPLLSGASVLTFAAALIATSFEVNRGWWQSGATARPIDPGAPAVAAEKNAELVVLTYAWGGLIMLAVYKISGITWQHGWQYGAGMLLIAVLLSIYGWQLSRPDSHLRRPRALLLAAQVSALHAIAALVALGWLVGSGKMASAKGDWPANQIFLAGGIAIAVLSAFAAFTLIRLQRANRQTDRLVAARSR